MTSLGADCPIGVFDSGIGGLSVLKEIQQLLPNENLIYVGDSAHAPYGDRSAEYVKKRSQFIAEFLLDQGVKAIVIACNTATAIAAKQLRETMDIPVVGLEPAIKPAAKISKNGIIGVLATQQTIDSERLLGLTERYANDKKVLAQACPGLVELVESSKLDHPETEALLKKYIQPLLKQGVDVLILGCTHYPFLLTSILNIIDTDIKVLETGKPVAQQLKRILAQNNLEKFGENKTSTLTFYNSSNDIKHHNTMKKLWQRDITINELPNLN